MTEQQMRVINVEPKLRSVFDIARESIWGTPGFIPKSKHIKSPGNSWQPSSTYVVETLRNNDVSIILIEMINDDGSYRIVLPAKVVECIYRQEYNIKAEARKVRGKTAAESRKIRDDLRRSLLEAPPELCPTNCTGGLECTEDCTYCERCPCRKCYNGKCIPAIEYQKEVGCPMPTEKKPSKPKPSKIKRPKRSRRTVTKK